MKRNACEGCYRSRVKCEYVGENATRCQRCARQNRECRPRVVLRRGRYEGVVPLSELDLEAYRSAAIFESLPHLGRQLAAAASLVKTYKALGFNEPPASLLWVINSMYLIASTEKSVSLLHTTTTLAVSTNTPIDLSVLCPAQSPFTEEMKASFDQEIRSEFLQDSRRGACAVVRVDCGDRVIMTNPMFEFLFDNAPSLAKRLDEAPHLRLWRDYLFDKTAADDFTTRMVKSWLLAGDPKGDPPSISWTCTNVGETEIKDNKGNHFLGTLFEHGRLVNKGFLSYIVVGVKDLKPMLPAGEARMRDFQAMAEAAKFSGVSAESQPAVIHFDSVWSLMLPEPALDSSEIDEALSAGRATPGGTPASSPGGGGGGSSGGGGGGTASVPSPGAAKRLPPPAPLAGPPGMPTAPKGGNTSNKPDHVAPPGRLLPVKPEPVHGTLPDIVPAPAPQFASNGQGHQPVKHEATTAAAGGGKLPSRSAVPDVRIPIPADAHEDPCTADAGEERRSGEQAVGCSSPYDLSSLVHLDSVDLWDNLDKVIEGIGGHESLVNDNWTH